MDETSRLRRPAGQGRPRLPRDGRAPAPAAAPAERPRRRALVETLAAEVARLEAELAAARAEATALAARAEEDALTGALNRRGFERELTRALSYLARYDAGAVLLYLDLDGFKPLNDRLGHGAGDAALAAVARTLSAHVRASDAVGRLGGDEFALILWNIAPADAARKAAALADLIAALPEGAGGLGASIGVAALSGADTPADALARADAAMYAAKRARRVSGA